MLNRQIFSCIQNVVECSYIDENTLTRMLFLTYLRYFKNSKNESMLSYISTVISDSLNCIIALRG